MIKELYQNHGKTLHFAGVIISNAPSNAPESERTANVAANLAKWILGADGAVLDQDRGSAPELTMALTAQRCEELGIRTALALAHQGIDASEITLKASTVFSNVPQVDAMVSMGTSTASPMLTLRLRIRSLAWQTARDGKRVTKAGNDIRARSASWAIRD